PEPPLSPYTTLFRSMVHVPYKGGAGPAVTGLVAGETQMMFSTVSSAMGYIKGGRLKALAVTSTKRLEPLPEVPTMRESGYLDGRSEEHTSELQSPDQ